MPRFESPSHWTPDLVRQHIDGVLLRDAYHKLGEELYEKRYSRRATAKNDYQRISAAVLEADEWAEKLFARYLEIWDLQGFPRSQALYTAIGETIQQGLGGHSAAFIGELNRDALVKRRPVDAMTLRGYKARMNALAGKWDRRVEVESRQAMYAAKRELANSPDKSQVAEPPRKINRNRPGRKPKIEPSFRRFAGSLWREKQDSQGKVSDLALKEIGAALDSSPYTPPSDHLEGKAAGDLKAHNSKNGHSKKKLMTWTAIATGNNPFKIAMRRTLCRCAERLPK